MMDEYLRTDIFNERMDALGQEDKRQNRRIEILEQSNETLTKLVISVEKLAGNIENMQKELEKNATRLEKIEQEPADKWKAVRNAIISGLVGAILGFLLKGGI